MYLLDIKSLFVGLFFLILNRRIFYCRGRSNRGFCSAIEGTLAECTTCSSRPEPHCNA